VGERDGAGCDVGGSEGLMDWEVQNLRQMFLSTYS
jgi:hypothetical protein